MMTPKTNERWVPGRGQPRYCEIKECGKVTREGKPFCTEHVEKHIYVKDLLQRINEKCTEEERAFTKGAKVINIDSATSKDIILHLKTHGPLTVERMSRKTQLPYETINAYAKAFKERGILETSKNSRNYTILKLVKTA
jgi:predicted transcriptional regulator